jgi:hypothetical protein
LGRVTCGKIVASVAGLVNFICLCGFIKWILCSIFGYLHEALREDGEDLQDLPPKVDPLFYKQTKDLAWAQERYKKLKILKTYKI